MREQELVIVAKIGDFEGLKQADHVETHEQMEVFIDGKGRIRVRKTVDDTGTSYESAIKSLAKPGVAVKDVAEIPQQISPEFFEGFRIIASSLKVKTRYTFKGESSVINFNGKEVNLPPIDYEVDVFERPDGESSQWCKIDIELDEFFQSLRSVEGLETGEEEEYLNFTVKVSHLPFKPQNAFILGACTEEQEAAVKELWAKEWSKTPNGEAVEEQESSISELKPEPTSEEEGSKEDNEEVTDPTNDQPPEENTEKADDEQPNEAGV